MPPSPGSISRRRVELRRRLGGRRCRGRSGGLLLRRRLLGGGLRSRLRLLLDHIDGWQLVRGRRGRRRRGGCRVRRCRGAGSRGARGRRARCGAAAPARRVVVVRVWALAGTTSKAITPAACTSRKRPLPCIVAPSARFALSAFTPAKLHQHIAGHSRYMFSGLFPDFFLICPATHFVAPKELGNAAITTSSAPRGCNCVSPMQKLRARHAQVMHNSPTAKALLTG